MGLLQKAYETYEAHQALAGIYEAEKEPLAPVGHIITSAQLEVTLDAQGNFRSAAAVDKNAPKIIIPVTEESSGRTSGICPHPLCDQIGYLTPNNDKKYAAYMEQLTDWAESEYNHPKVKAVLAYVSKGTLKADLTDAGIKKFGDKDLVCWRVLGVEGESDACYKDRSLFDSYTAYYLHRRQQESTVLCMVSGEQVVLAHQHLKGISAFQGNAKLISANDTVNFTYRGRFLDDEQALTVGYEASQKAHNALKWLISNQRVVAGGRIFLCWNPQGIPVPQPHRPMRKSDAAKVSKPSDYQSDVQKILMSYKAKLPQGAGVVLAAFDAATTGRLALTYYGELQASDFLDRLAYWDSTCCFVHSFNGIAAPALDRIIRYAWGTERSSGIIELDDRIFKQHMQRLISCRVDKAVMPLDIMQALVKKASNPLAYKSDINRENIVFTACAVIRKYHMDHMKEEWEMALQPDKKDRSYQYGRLLAVMEKVERDTYGREDGRDPNAIRMQSVFCQRPAYTAEIVLRQLKKAYMPRLKYGSQIFYEGLIGEIYERLSEFSDEELNAPLSETYLMGYYLQKNKLYQKNNENTEEE